MSQRIAIVGGGYIGFRLAKALENEADITLIEQRSHFVHAAAMIRAMVDPSILELALIPYDKLLQRGTWVQARAAAVDGSGVVLEDGHRIDADFVVIATGSENATPFKAKGADIAGLRSDNARIHGMLVAATTVAIVGAGAVGTELAGEIAHAMPDKKVVLIAGQSQLFPDKPEQLGRSLAAKLQAAGVEVALGVRAENLQSETEPYAGVLKLSDGREIKADLVFPVIGSRASSKLLDGLPGAKHAGAGRIKVDAWMRPSSLENVFAAGDVAEMGDAMTIVAATRQLPWLKNTLSALLKGKKLPDLKPYKHWSNAPIVVPLGPKKGHSFLKHFTAGDFLTRELKGKHLFVPRYRKELGQG